ncbi:carboxylic ester hydrolase-like [Epargyreus clarus]|uniref:carboxylic ester hydrolase-like n=1 Tax=Epargyreus clarus TaxID=520877 RepID=UPI003C2B46A3
MDQTRVICIVLCCFVCVYAYNEPVTSKTETRKQPVSESYGGYFVGVFNKTRRGRLIETYRGIRYAEPPVGELRFQPPRLIYNYRDPVDATKDGPACPIRASPGYYVDEDCLRINVYTPADRDKSKRLPVIFYIHPGGFYSMTGRSDLAGPHYLLDRDVVLVTMNYRLGTLGFISTGDALAPGNLGFKDQVAALKWVQEHIGAFGGDPKQVTIAGCSAGSISVMLHMISPMSKGLFHRGIAMSGSATLKIPNPTHQRHLAVKQAAYLNCSTDTTKAMIDCLKTKDWRDIGRSRPIYNEFGFDPLGIYTPVVEPDFGQERFLPIQPMDAIRENKMHAVPFIIGTTTDEFFWLAYNPLRNETLRKQFNEDWDRVAPISFMLPRDKPYPAVRRLKEEYLHNRTLADDDASAKALGRLYADSITSFPIHRMANLMCRHSPQPVYYYEFAHVGNHSHYEARDTKKPVASAHHDDLIYLFTLSYRFPEIPVDDSRDSKMVDIMTAVWYNFARYGDPNPRGDTPELSALQWPPMTPDKRTYLRMDPALTTHENLSEERFGVWEELYPIQFFHKRKQKGYKMDINWWRTLSIGSGDGCEPRDGCAAERMWRSACNTLVAPNADDAWKEIVEAAPPDSMWHSLRNCVAYQAGVWQNLLMKGIDDVMHPAAFKLAIVLRHTPSELTVKLLSDLLPLHPQSQDLTAYVLSLLTDDEAWCGSCGSAPGSGIQHGVITSSSAPTPLRDLQLFGDCELAVLAASREEYDAHAKLVRAEYAKLSNENYVDLRLKILNQFSQIPKLYNTMEFECFESAARENVDREITTLREHLLAERHD